MSFVGTKKTPQNVKKYAGLCLQMKNGRELMPSFDCWVYICRFSYK